MNFETVIGLEVHCELKTKSKMFSGAPVTFGEAPNTNANIVDMGMTGAMPVLNKSGVEFAIRVCSALNMEIDELVQFDRKNYYYSDLPKGFQITQDRFPIGRNGTMKIEVNGQTQVIEIDQQVKLGTLWRLPGITWRKVGMTSNHQDRKSTRLNSSHCG